MRPQLSGWRNALSVAVFLLVATASLASVSVTTIDASSGKPLNEARVVLSIRGRSIEGMTDGAGTCQLNFPDLKGARVDVRRDGWCPMQWDAAENPAADLNALTVKMRKAAAVGGSVVDADGKGVAGARVFVIFPQRLWGARIPVDDFPIRTGADGKWTANFVPSDAGYIHLQVSHPDYARDETKSEPSLEKIKAGLAVSCLEAIQSLQGKVLDPAGQPVAGATVVRGSEWGIMGLESGHDTTTDAKGGFHFPPEKSGKIQVAAFAPGFGPVIKNVTVAARMPAIELSLTKPQTRRIRVTDLEGNGLSNIEVRVSEWGAFRYPPWSFKTDAYGRVVMTNAPADEIRVDAMAPNRMGARFYTLPATREEQVIRLGPSLRLHGRVTDAATGNAVASFKITPGWPDRSFAGDHMTNAARWGYQSKPFHGGTYDWTFDEPIVSGTREPSDFLLRVEAEGYATAISRAFKATEKDAEFDFQLTPPTYINGVVRFGDGSPAAGAKIYQVNRMMSEFQTENGKVRSGRRLSCLTTDAGGHFKMEEQHEAESVVAWHEGGFGVADYADFQKTKTIVLTKWGRIEGSLRRGRDLAANATVALCFEPQWIKEGKRLRPKERLFYHYQTTTDDQGHFLFDTVPPGEAAVARVESIPRPDRFGMALGDVWGGCRLAVVNVPEGGTVTVNAGGAGRTVAGKFISTNDFSQGEATLTRSLPPIPYPDGLDDAAKDKWAATWFWSDATEPDRVWLGGTPQSAAPAIGRPAGHSWAVKVEADGRFEIPDVPPGDYTVAWTPLNASRRFYMRQVGNQSEPGALRRGFTAPPGENLPTLPAMDLGAIGPVAPAVEFAVAEPSAHEPVTAAMTTDRAEVRPGETFQLLARVRIAEGHHIYAANTKTKAFTPTGLHLTLPDGVEAISDWSEPTPIEAADGEKIYTNSVVYSRSLKLTAPAAPGPISFKGELRYQVCNDQMCWPPKTVPLEASLTVQPSSKGTP